MSRNNAWRTHEVDYLSENWGKQLMKKFEDDEDLE
jgi:hypothetical protein